ncbi:ferroxidase fet3 [Tilletia horrida]|uniref:Ferroxidase fet3 n=1 Tax=Tilletia horrida TaxID=155126 RepID=A0AAN6JP67_9BASI|nr:ferroxidase fet3 [Tilletia horrida]KAK0559162.1 ferroxidase fet3 [Tilletia horrida]
MLNIRSAIFPTLVASLVAKAANVQLDWNISWVPDVNPDGLQPRRAIGVNGQWPLPVININSTDVFSINVSNQLGDGSGTSLHSHGMFFNRTSYYDGAVGVTQCPIPPGQSINYEPVNSPASPADRQKQWGTYWTHGHHMGQYVDGLRTPTVIHRSDAPEAHTYDDDYVIALADWYHDEHQWLLENEFLNEKNPSGAEPVPKSALLYIAHTSAANPTATILPGFNENVTLPFVPGKTYRLRIVNMAALAMFHFWIEGHDMRIIEVDGTDVQELPVEALTISVAQRYSVLVTARNSTTTAPAQNWLMHANMDPGMFDAVPDDLQLNITSTIGYPDATENGSDRPLLDEYSYFDDTQLVPVEVEGMADPNVEFDLNVSFDTYDNGQNYASFNNITYVSPKTPALFSAKSMASLASNKAIYGPSSNAHVFNSGDFVQVTVYNWDAGTHPFHLHGHKFQIVWKSQDITSDDPAINPPFNPNQTNPIRRDTVTIPSMGFAVLRFRADNPGAWMFHCHIDWHLSSGLVAFFVEAPTEIQTNLAIPSILNDQCEYWKTSPTGNAAGLNSTTEFGSLPVAHHYLESGWTAKAVGAFVGCILTALLGLATVAFYAYGGMHDPEGDEEEEDDAQEAAPSTLATPDEK